MCNHQWADIGEGGEYLRECTRCGAQKEGLDDGDFRTKLAALMQECLVEEGGRFFATIDGAVKLKRLLKETGLDCEVRVVDGRFELD